MVLRAHVPAQAQSAVPDFRRFMYKYGCLGASRPFKSVGVVLLMVVGELPYAPFSAAVGLPTGFGSQIGGWTEAVAAAHTPRGGRGSFSVAWPPWRTRAALPRPERAFLSLIFPG